MKKNLLIIILAFIGLFMVSCERDSSKNEEYPDITTDNMVLKGTLKNRIKVNSDYVLEAWKYGIADIKMIVGNNDVLSKGSVKADGTFELTIPGTLTGKYFFGLTSLKLSEGGSVIANPETVRVFNSFYLKVRYLDGKDSATMYPQLHSFTSDFIPDRLYTLYCFDKEGSFNGTSKKGNTYDWSFGKGWQWIESGPQGASTTLYESRTIESIPSNTYWTN